MAPLDANLHGSSWCKFAWIDVRPNCLIAPLRHSEIDFAKMDHGLHRFGQNDLAKMDHYCPYTDWGVFSKSIYWPQARKAPPPPYCSCHRWWDKRGSRLTYVHSNISCVSYVPFNASLLNYVHSYGRLLNYVPCNGSGVSSVPWNGSCLSYVLLDVSWLCKCIELCAFEW